VRLRRPSVLPEAVVRRIVDERAGGRAGRGAVASVESKVRQAWSMRRRCRRVPALRSSFAGFRFPPDVIIIAVRWYLRYSLSYRDIEELLAERGITVDHVSVYRWVQRFTPLLIDAARPCRHTPGDRWFVDETVRREARCDRAGVRGLRRLAVAAAGLKLRAV
jgi:hypothetical protein